MGAGEKTRKKTEIANLKNKTQKMLSIRDIWSFFRLSILHAAAAADCGESFGKGWRFLLRSLCLSFSFSFFQSPISPYQQFTFSPLDPHMGDCSSFPVLQRYS